jgi:hypothetical protein
MESHDSFPNLEFTGSACKNKNFWYKEICMQKKNSSRPWWSVEQAAIVLMYTVLIGLMGCKQESDPLSSEKLIKDFSITLTDGAGAEPKKGVINTAARTIAVSLPVGTSPTWLVPAITVSDLAKVSPASGMEVDFTTPQTYTVTAEDGTTQDYLVSVSVASPVLSNDKVITSFTLKTKDGSDVGADIPTDAEANTEAVVNTDIGADTITVRVPIGTDLSWLVPTIVVSPDASWARVAPPPSEADPFDETAPAQTDTPYDFSAPVRYVVTAQNGSTHEYLVTVTEAPVEKESLALKIELANDQIVRLFGITDAEIADTAKGIQLSKNGTRREVVISLTAYSTEPSSSSDVSWSVDGGAASEGSWDGTGSNGSTNIVTIRAENYTLGRHYVAFTGTKSDGSGDRQIPYSKTFYFTVDID